MSNVTSKDLLSRPDLTNLVVVALPGGSFCLLDPEVPFWIALRPEDHAIIRRCDGSRSFEEIVNDVSSLSNIEPQLIRRRLATLLVRVAKACKHRKESLPKSNQEMNVKLTGIYIELTNSCNLQCIHCYNSSGGSASRVELTTEQVERIINEAYKLGAHRVTISGGEPLIRSDIIHLLTYGRSLGLHITVITNGTLITERIARAFDELGVMVQISIDGSKQEIHDRIRGRGAFASMCRGLDKLLERGLAKRISFSTCLMRQNSNDLDNIIELALKLGIPNLNLIFVSKQGRATQIWNTISLPSKVLIDLAKYIFDRSQQLQHQLRIENELTSGLITTLLVGGSATNFSCTACREIRIDCQGDVYPCAFFDGLENRLGNLQQGSLAETLVHSQRCIEILNAQHRRVERVHKLKQCIWRKYCGGGCMAKAVHMCGTIWAACADCEVRKELYSYALSKLARLPCTKECAED